MSEGRDDGPPWGYVLAIGTVAVVAVALLVVPGMLAPQPTLHPSPSATPDPHALTTEQGTFTISYEGGALVVRRLDPDPVVLGRAIVPDEMHPAAGGDPLRGSGIWAMLCPGGTGGQALRVMFGSTFPTTNGKYTGPPAAFTIAADGLWLVVLEPGSVDPNARLDVSAAGGGGGLQAATFDSVMTDGRLQPSNCAIEG